MNLKSLMHEIVKAINALNDIQGKRVVDGKTYTRYH